MKTNNKELEQCEKDMKSIKNMIRKEHSDTIYSADELKVGDIAKDVTTQEIFVVCKLDDMEKEQPWSESDERMYVPCFQITDSCTRNGWCSNAKVEKCVVLTEREYWSLRKNEKVDSKANFVDRLIDIYENMMRHVNLLKAELGNLSDTVEDIEDE